MMKSFLNLALYQAAWIAAVLGAAGGRPWLGPAAVAAALGFHLALADDRLREIKLLLAAGLLGFFCDSGLVAAGVFSPLHPWLPRPWSPPWMVSLWMNFAATLNVSLAWLRGRYLSAAILGGIAGPLAYFSGAKLGATEALPAPGGLLALAAVWGVLTPLLVWLAQRFGSPRARHRTRVEKK